jgi:RNA polymerase sigma-B factor
VPDRIDRPLSPLPPGARTGVTPPEPGPCESALARRRRDDRLFERYADPDDPVDRNAVVERFLPLARHIASQYAHGGEPFEDVYQVACLALVHAVDRFDHGRDTAFSSYAVPTISGEVKRYFRDKTWAVHVPRELRELGVAAQRTRAKLTDDLGRGPTVSELAQRMKAPDDKVLDALVAIGARKPDSLDESRSGAAGEVAMAERLGREDEGFRRAEDRATIDRLSRRLNRRHREVIRMRFEEDLTQLEIGLRLGVSQMQVSRLLGEALDRLAADAFAPAAVREAA